MEEVDTKTWITEFGQQLEASETRCEAIKCHLSYMKNLYDGSPSESTEPCDESQNYFESTNINVQHQCPSESNDFKEFLIQENSHYQGFMNDIHKMQCYIEETIAESPRSTRERIKKASQISLKVDLDLSDDGEKKIEQLSDFQSKTPRSIILSSRNEGNESFRDRDTNKTFQISKNIGQGSDYQIIAPVIKSARKHVIEIPIYTEKQEEEVDNFPVQNKIKKEDLVLRFTRSMESARTNKKKKSSKHDRRYKTALNKSVTNRKSNGKIEDNIISTAKIKKRKGKLRSSSSRSTIATRDTNLSERKDYRRKRNNNFLQKNSRSTISCFQKNQAVKAQQNMNDVVELYHNMAVKSGSISVISSKHSRLDSHIQDSFHGNPSHNYNKKSESHQHKMKKPETQQSPKLKNSDVLQKDNSIGNLKENDKENDKENLFRDNSETSHYYQSYPGSKFYDPMLIRNYEQPTVSSKLKRVSRSYFSRFNFKNIPFVVGTSISPSHNLGLNIQQVLSIMKAKQTRPSGITPILIRKMSQGIRPMTSLLNQMSNQNGFQNFDINEQQKESTLNSQSSQFDSKSRTFKFQQNYSNTIQQNNTRNICETLFEEKEESDRSDRYRNPSTKQGPILNKIIKGRKFDGQPELTQSTLLKQRQMELNMGDHNIKSYQNVSSNSKGIRDVLIKLHDQFEEMNTKYEKLHEKAEKSKDKSLTKEVEKLETELTAKEEEINAVVSLYKEVMALKKQMKLMTERNSFVCISTESPNPYPITNPAPINRAHTSPQLQMIQGRESIIGSTREPSTGTRLTGLLRQIQTFQKQLQQAS